MLALVSACAGAPGDPMYGRSMKAVARWLLARWYSRRKKSSLTEHSPALSLAPYFGFWGSRDLTMLALDQIREIEVPAIKPAVGAQFLEQVVDTVERAVERLQFPFAEQPTNDVVLLAHARHDRSVTAPALRRQAD